MMKCPQCGATAPDGQRFCGECGGRLQADDANERNAVLHRPGGGSPDPFSVGGSDSAVDDDDDFFSRFTPKSAVESGTAAPDADASFPTRRSRRRFNPSLYATGEVPSMQPPGTPAEPSAAQRQSPPPRDSERAPEPPQQDAGEGDSAFAPPQRAGEDAFPPLPPIAPQAEAPQVEVPQQAESPAVPAAESMGEPTSEPFERAAPFREQDRAQDGAPAHWARPSQPTDPDDPTFTQLIRGLQDDPADHPIQAGGFDKTGVVPLPPRAPEPDAEVREAQERAAAFWGQRNRPEPEAAPASEAPHPEAAPSPTDTPEQRPELEPHDTNPFDAIFGDLAEDDGADDVPAAPEPTERSSHDGGRDESIDHPFVTQAGASDAAELDDARASRRDTAAAAGAAAAAAAAGVSASASASASAADGMPSLPPLDHPDAAPTAAFAAPGAPGGPTHPAAPQREQSTGDGGDGGRRRGVLTIAIAAAAAAVLLLGAWGISSLFGGKDDKPVAGETTSEAPSETGPVEPSDATTPSETPTPTPESFEPVAFQSASGNLRCQITAESGAACQLLVRQFSVPDGECRGPNYQGVAVGVNAEGTTWPCLNGDLAGSVIDYDTPVTAGEYTCSINYDTGANCSNGKGDSFTIEYSQGVQLSGSPAPDPNIPVDPVR